MGHGLNATHAADWAGGEHDKARSKVTRTFGILYCH